MCSHGIFHTFSQHVSYVLATYFIRSRNKFHTFSQYVSYVLATFFIRSHIRCGNSGRTWWSSNVHVRAGGFYIFHTFSQHVAYVLRTCFIRSHNMYCICSHNICRTFSHQVRQPRAHVVERRDMLITLDELRCGAFPFWEGGVVSRMGLFLMSEVPL
jgi:hypothetical protein